MYNIYRRNSCDTSGNSFDYGRKKEHSIPINTEVLKSLSDIRNYFFDMFDIEPIIVNIDTRAWAVYMKPALTGMDYINYFIIRE